jgi:hypothetical protein
MISDRKLISILTETFQTVKFEDENIKILERLYSFSLENLCLV